jgi:hypothetical protein
VRVHEVDAAQHPAQTGDAADPTGDTQRRDPGTGVREPERIGRWADHLDVDSTLGHFPDQQPGLVADLALKHLGHV